MDGTFRICAIALDPRIRSRLSDETRTECDIAIRDTLAENHFRPVGSPGGPYQLLIGMDDGHLVFQLFLEDNTPHGTAILSTAPYKRRVAEYTRLCQALGEAGAAVRLPDQIEAIDMARRALHNEGAQLFMERLEGKVEMDMATARGLFTIISQLMTMR